MDDLIDIQNSISSWADDIFSFKGVAKAEEISLKYAQASFLHLQHCSNGFENSNQQLLRILQDQSNLSWNKVTDVLSDKKKPKLSIRDALNLSIPAVIKEHLATENQPNNNINKIAFLNSVTNAYLSLFETSLTESDVIWWSLIRKAISYARIAIAFSIIGIQSKKSSNEEKNQIVKLFPNLVAKLGQCLKKHLQIVAESEDAFNATPWINGKPMGKELLWVMDTYEFFQKNSSITTEGMDKINQFVLHHGKINW